MLMVVLMCECMPLVPCLLIMMLILQIKSHASPFANHPVPHPLCPSVQFNSLLLFPNICSNSSLTNIHNASNVSDLNLFDLICHMPITGLVVLK